MPKPTFIQSVLGKPTRKYASPNAPSPWADVDPGPYYEPSQWSSQVEIGSSRNNQWQGDIPEAGPSRRPRRVKSTISDISDNIQPTAGTRFPKPVRKVASEVVLKDDRIVHVASTTVGSSRGRREKTKPVQQQYHDDASITSSQPSSTSFRPVSRSKHHVNFDTSSSARSSPVPTSPSVSSERQKPRPSSSLLQRPPISANTTPISIVTTMVTPPSSDMSITTKTSLASETRIVTPALPPGVPPIVIPPSDDDQEPPPPSAKSGTASETEAEGTFYTPTSSVESLISATTSVPAPPVLEVAVYSASPVDAAPSNPLTPRASNTLHAVGFLSQSTATGPPALAPPSFTLQPPTPAPLSDPDTSPFHSQSKLSSSSSSHHPDHHPTDSQSKSDNGRNVDDTNDDVQTAVSENGSDNDGLSPEMRRGSFKNGPTDRRSSFGIAPPIPMKSPERARQASLTRSPRSSIDGRQSPPRAASRQSIVPSTSRNSYDDFVIRRRSIAGSEASYGGRSATHEGSFRASMSGNGKGGWAAAASIRSGASSPVMMMPTSGQDGWADFHIPVPPRHSRFTPLPPASQPMTFDRLVNGSRPGINGPRSGSSLPKPGRIRSSSPGAESSLSDYSQGSDGNMPRPSRSYVNKDSSSEAGQTHSSFPDDDLPRLRNRRESLIDYNDYHVPEPRPSRQQTYPRPGSRLSYFESRASSPGARPGSRMSLHARPTSPSMSSYDVDPPRMGLHPPSFLNPDTLTLLPEMTEEDSSALYRPSPSEWGGSRKGSPPRRSNSVFGMARLSRSEVFHEGREEDDDDESSQRRSKSVMGRRKSGLGSEVKWEGSSYGEGVLMESNGKAQEGLGGYTNLFLPAGAYKPSNPLKAPQELNSRILGLPHSTMASITLSTSVHRNLSTPLHLRDQLPPPVDFTSHLKPPSKVNDSQLLVQIYAVAIDEMDVKILDEKGKGDVGKWVPGRSFVGRCMMVGSDEKDIVRGDLVIGLFDIRKSGALSEYVLADRRRLARAPLGTSLTLEQMALLPLQGIIAARAIRTHLTRQSRALIMDAHNGVAALVCQEMARYGVNVTAVIPGGDQVHFSQLACMNHGARGVLTGSPAAVMLSLDEGGWDYVFDTVGGVRVYDAAKRILKDGGKLITLCPPDNATTSLNPSIATSKSSSLKNFRAAFQSRRRDTKFISFLYLAPPGSPGEPEVDSSGVDNRDILEEDCMSEFRPVVGKIWKFEEGMECFRGKSLVGRGDVEIVRLVN